MPRISSSSSWWLWNQVSPPRNHSQSPNNQFHCYVGISAVSRILVCQFVNFAFLLPPLTSRLPNQSAMVCVIAEDFENICETKKNTYSGRRTTGDKLSCLSQICRWELSGLWRWLDLLDKKAKPAQLSFSSPLAVENWRGWLKRWYDLLVYTTLWVPVTARRGSGRQIKGCYYKWYLHRKGLHQIWWIFSFCFCDISPLTGFCECHVL